MQRCMREGKSDPGHHGNESKDHCEGVSSWKEQGSSFSLGVEHERIQSQRF